MQPDQQNNNVWISREEYDRLQAQAASAQIPAVPVVGAAPSSAQSSKVNDSQKIVGLFLAIGLFLSLTSSFFRFITIPIVALIILYAVMSLIDFMRSKRVITSGVSAQTTAAKRKGSPYKTLLVILGCLLMLPIMAYGALIILFFIIMGLGGGQGS